MQLTAPKDSKLVLWFAWFVFTAGICALLVAEDLRLMQNSDVFYLPVLSLDLRSWGGHIGEWAMPPAPYFFPDLVLYSPLFLLTGNPHVSLILAGVAQYFLFVAGWILLCRRSAGSAEAQLFGQLVILVLAGAVLTLEPLREIALMSQPLTMHFGVMAAVPYVLVVADSCLKAGTRRALSAWLGVLLLFTVLLGLSDPLSVVQVVLPLAASAGFLVMLGQLVPGRALAVAGAALAGGAAGVALLRRIEHPAVYYYVQTAIPLAGTAAGEFIEWIRSWSAGNGAGLLLCGGAFAVQVVLIGLSVSRAVRQVPLPAAAVLLSCFSVLAVAFNVLGVVATGNFYGISAVRYIMTLLFLPAFGLAASCCLMQVTEKNVKQLVLLAVALLCMLAAANSGFLSRTADLRRYADHYPAWIRWLDSETRVRNLSCGIGTYWDAKYVTLLSKTGLKILQANADFSPYNWISNTAWYDRFEPRFFLCTTDPADSNRIQADKVMEKFGKPSESFCLSNLVVLVYNGEPAAGFQSWLREHPARTDFRRLGARAVFSVQYLELMAGVVSNDCCTAAGGRDNPGCLAGSSFVHVPAGQYRAAIRYAASSRAEDGRWAGTWDISLKKRHAVQIVKEGWLPSGQQKMDILFELAEPSVVAVRVSFTGQGSLSVKDIELERKP